MNFYFSDRQVIPTLAAALLTSTQASAQTDAARDTQTTDIVVTAQKREQRLQDVPVAVNIVSSQALEHGGLTSVADLNRLVPALNITANTSAALVVLRGLGSLSVSPGNESLTPIYVDGVYQASQQGNIFELTSIERIEVLKGPQGTLFGRNAVAGAINILTLDPSHDPGGKVSLTYGRYNTRTLDAYLTSGITDTLAVNFTAHGSKDDGYIRDLVRGPGTPQNGGNKGVTDHWSLRSKLLWEPSDNVRARLVLYHNQLDDSVGVASHPLDTNSAVKITDPNVLLNTGNTYSGNIDVFWRSKNTGGSADVTWQLGSADLTAISSYSKVVSRQTSDSDASSVNIGWTGVNVSQRTYTEELRLASTNNESPLAWIVGAYYFDDKSMYDPLLISLGTRSQTPTVGSKAIAVFGEVSYKLGKFTLTGGLRYSSEKRSLNQVVNGVFLAAASKRFKDATPRISLQYAFTRDIAAYLTYSEGFKSGIYNASLTTLPLTPVNPQTIKAYEAGLKTQFPGGIRLNISTFYYDIRNLQENRALPPANVQQLVNTGRAEDYGGEIEFSYSPNRRITLTAGVAYNHARYKDYPGAVYYLPRADGLGNTLTVINAAGNPLLRAPDWSANIGGVYTVPIGTGSIQTSANYAFQSRFYWDPGKYLSTGATHQINAKLSWLSEGDKFSLSLIGKNLTNSDHYIYKFGSTTVNYGVQAQPRWYGVQAGMNF